MYSISDVFRPVGSFAPVWLAVLLFGWLPASTAPAQQIDMSLNLLYNDVNNASSGGLWQIAVKTDSAGLASAFARINGISDPQDTVLLGPTGIVNTDDAAGFRLLVGDFSTHYTVALTQVPLGTPDTDQSVFYGVGSIVDPEGGVPNYPDRITEHPDSTAIGPELTTLSNLNNPVWGNGDPLGDAAWDHAAILAQGTFAPGQTPSFFETEDLKSQGQVFLEPLPTNSDELATSSDVLDAMTTVVRSNFEAPPGDFNGDGVVNLADYSVWRDNLGATVIPAGSGIDADGSGMVDAGDYDIWKMNFGLGGPMPVSGVVSASRVPEPGSCLLLMFCSVFLVFLTYPRWRRRQSEEPIHLFFIKKTYSPEKLLDSPEMA